MSLSPEEREEFYKKILQAKEERYLKKFQNPGLIEGKPLKPKKKKQRKVIDRKMVEQQQRDTERIERYKRNSKEFDNYRQRGFDKDGRFNKDGKIYKEK